MKRRSFKLISVAGIMLIAMFVLTRAALAASYTFTTLNDPSGAAGTTNTIRINDSGDIVGYYTDSNGACHGFLYSDGTYTPIHDPSAGTGQYLGTRALGINDFGDIVGSYYTSNGMDGFLYSGGTYTRVDDPSGVDNTYAGGINDSKDIVGFYGNSANQIVGFLDINKNFINLNYPNATGTYATDINDNGVIVGFYTDSSGGTHGFVYSDGTYTRLDDPSGVGNTYAIGINDSGDIVGYYTDSNGTFHGFLYSGSTYAYFAIDDSSAGTGQIQGTQPGGINNNGDIVGTYFDSSGGSHGFLATPQTTLLQNAIYLGADWYYLSPFGFFYNKPGSAWIYHQTLGWLCTYNASTDGIWIWDPQWNGTGGWWWTSSSFFPWLYSATEHEWLCYDADATGGRWFWNSSTGWTTH